MKLFFRINRNALHYKQMLVLEEALRMNGSGKQECRLDQKIVRTAAKFPLPCHQLKSTHTLIVSRTAGTV